LYQPQPHKAADGKISKEVQTEEQELNEESEGKREEEEEDQ
jgi:hypothetical protein